jgi:hypothetical protein
MEPLTGSGYSTRVVGGASATIPGHLFPDLDEGATISFWFRLDTVAPYVNSVMSKAVPGGHPRSMALCLLPDGPAGPDSARLIWISDGGTSGGGDTVIEVGEVYHLALTYTPSTQFPGRVDGMMFVNGTLAFANSGGAVDSSEMDFNIGGWSTSEAGIDGLIDDVQIYDRPLSSDEITTLHSNPGLTLTDLDRDTLLDDYEFATFGTLRETPQSDYDGDGLSNQTETETTRTDPGSFASRFTITDVSRSGGQHHVTFLSTPGVTYQLEMSSGNGNWIPIGPTVSASTPSTTLSHSSGPGSGVYRVATR